jgi:hypothetical protein
MRVDRNSQMMTRLGPSRPWAYLLLPLAGIGLCQAGASDKSTASIELTSKDLFAIPGWNSSQVSVLGFRLGMTWPEVSAEARARHLTLKGSGDPRREPPCEGKGWCLVCEAPGVCNGLALVFGAECEIVKLSISKTPDFAAKEVQAAALQKRAKGATRDLLERYSKDLRLKLLGPESSQTTTETKDLIFTYRQLGLIVQVSPCPKDLPESTCAGLILEFVPPSPATK